MLASFVLSRFSHIGTLCAYSCPYLSYIFFNIFVAMHAGCCMLSHTQTLFYRSTTGSAGVCTHRKNTMIAIDTRYTITVTAMQDDAPVIGNASAIDEATDAAIEQAILERLEYDVWAWALVTVNVTDELTGKSASACLGSCSYEDENDFRNNSGYFDDMVQECIDELSE